MNQTSFLSAMRSIALIVIAYAAGRHWLTPEDSGMLTAILVPIGALAGPFLWGVYAHLNSKIVPQDARVVAQHAIVVDPIVTPDNMNQPGATVKTADGVIAGKVVGALLFAFALSFLLAGNPAQAQTKLPHLQITGRPIEDTKANFGLTGNASADIQALWQKIVGSSLNDLNYAAAMAKNANTLQATTRLQCINAIITLNKQASGIDLKDEGGNPLVKPDPHVFTDVETLAEVVDNLAPTGPLFVSCAGAAQLAKTNVLSFVNAVVTGAAGFAAMPIIPGL